MEGILVINKPTGITSTQVVNKVKRKLKTRVGHSGTLDPIAEGILLLLIGKATRFSWIFTQMEKTYYVSALLGVETDTYDLEGNLLRKKEVNVSCKQLEEILREFKGEIQQQPPPFCAKKVKGKRAYKLARKGITPPLKPIKVKIYSLKLKKCHIPHFEIEASVSSGTYIRSLIHDIGKRLSTGAVVSRLIRTRVGPFSLNDAISLEDFLKSENPKHYLLSTEESLRFLPSVFLDYFHGKKVLNGNTIPLKDCFREGSVKIYVDNKFVGIGEVKNGLLKPRRLLPIHLT